MSLNIAINGFGRIGRSFLRSFLSDKHAREKISIKAINLGPSSPECAAQLFKYDSIMGTYPGNVSYSNGIFTIDGLTIQAYTEREPTKLPWSDLSIDWVVESSGCFTKREGAELHQQAGAKKVLITAPAKDEDLTVIPGINHTTYDSTKHSIVSLGSCTTNCFAPLVKVLHENFTLETGLMTTVHSYTNTQVLLDVEHKDLRRARAAALNIIPTHTGASKVIIKIFPELEGKLDAVALRVPTPNVSIVDFSFTTKESITAQQLNQTFKKASQESLKGVLGYSQEPLVSSDYIGNTDSAIIDSEMTKAIGHTGKVFAWYDNEYGYASKLKDFLLYTVS